MNFRPLARRRRGAAILEFALVVPILLAILLGVIEFSIYGQNALRVANAAREGARTAATGKTVATIKARVAKFANPVAVDGGTGSVKVEVSGDGGNTYSTLGDDASGTQNAAQPDQYVRVTAQGTNQPVTGVFGGLFRRPITSQVVMRRERVN